MKRAFLILVLILSNNILYSQRNISINRLYFNFGMGIEKAIAIGGNIQFLNYLMFSYNHTESKHLVAGAKFFSSKPKLYNDYISNNFLIGISSNQGWKLDVDLLFGLSDLKGKLYHDINYNNSYPYQNAPFYTYQTENIRTVGFASRVDLNYQFNKGVALNLGLQNVLSKKCNQLTFTVGICFGLVRG